MNQHRHGLRLALMTLCGLGLSAVPLVAAPLYTITDLGTLGGHASVATGINAAGQVVGYSDTAGDALPHAFLYSGGPLIDLGTLGGSTSIATGINTAGQIVGQAETATGASHAFLYSGGTMHDLGTLGGDTSIATGINAAGQVVGWSYTTGDAAMHAFRYSGGWLEDLGTLGGDAQPRPRHQRCRSGGWIGEYGRECGH